MTGAGEAWRNSAREVLGIGAYREQKYVQARILFQEIVDDPSATPGLRDRAHVMIALIDPHVMTVTPSQAEEPAQETAPAAEAASEQGAIAEEASGEVE